MLLKGLLQFAVVSFLLSLGVFGQVVAETCPRPAVGSPVNEPEDLRSKNGVLRVDFAYRSFVDAHGLVRYCYINKQDGSQSPTLRVKPGDQVVLTLKNELPEDGRPLNAMAHRMSTASVSHDCAGGPMTASTTNLHFHGLSIPPVCHQDETLKTLIQPSSPPFEYKFRIPRDQPPGLYWYHPHVHGFNKVQVLGGASGALIVEGLEKANDAVAGLPERVLTIRDQELINPDAQPVQSGSMPPPIVLRDAEGDILNAGTGTGKPAKDLSLNFVPVPYPEYRPAVITTRPSERQLWRVLNASSITYLDLQVLYSGVAQRLGVVALDGVPVNMNGNDTNKVVWKSHIFVPPAGRAEFTVKGPPEGIQGSLVTRSVDSGPAGENDPTRPLASIVSSPEVPEPQSKLPTSPTALASLHTVPLKEAVPARQRKLYFSERPQDPNNPNSPLFFFITVDGQTPAPFDPNSRVPNLTVRQGDVEDWVIENRSQELHAFHIHQIHFQLLEWNAVPVDEPYLRDTVNLPYWDGKSPVYPSVKLRMDFRNRHIVGTFVYHCHLLEHEDAGMMGTIRVEASPQRPSAKTEPPTKLQQAQVPDRFTH
jgi:FtsP/CotA-like multicopper oxidase with cupredoxin domain